MELNRSLTYDLPITSSAALPLVERLVRARPINHVHFTVIPFPIQAITPSKDEHPFVKDLVKPYPVSFFSLHSVKI